MYDFLLLSGLPSIPHISYTTVLSAIIAVEQYSLAVRVSTLSIILEYLVYMKFTAFLHHHRYHINKDFSEKNAANVLYKCISKLFIATTPLPYFIYSLSVISQHLSFDNLYTEVNVKLI